MKQKENHFECPLCGGKMTEIKDDTGAWVKCLNPCVPTCHETVYGHGSTLKDAYEVACQKYRKSS